MYKTLAITLLLLTPLAHADMTSQTASSAVDARQTWQSLPPAAQQALMSQAQTEAQQYRQNWQQMSPEQQAAQKQAWRSQAQERASASGMQPPMRAGMGGAAMAESSMGSGRMMMRRR